MDNTILILLVLVLCILIVAYIRLETKTYMLQKELDALCKDNALTRTAMIELCEGLKRNFTKMLEQVDEIEASSNQVPPTNRIN